MDYFYFYILIALCKHMVYRLKQEFLNELKNQIVFLLMGYKARKYH